MINDSTGAMPPPVARPQPLAHWAHTVGLLLFLVTWAWLGHQRVASTASATMVTAAVPRLLRYASSITLEWLLVGSVIAGIYARRDFFVRAFADRTRSLAASIGLGVAVYCVGTLLLATAGGLLYFTPLFHKLNEGVVLAMLPRTPAQFTMWFLVSLTAGMCEEVIFRGYLQQQLDSWMGRPVWSVVLTGVLFGGLHLYEGVAAMVPLALLGIFYGMVVRRLKGDLRAVIVAHTLQDFLVALLVLARPFAERYVPHP